MFDYFALKEEVQNEDQKLVKAETAGEAAYFCLLCRNQLAKKHQRLQVCGSDEHTFVNPAGVIFRIICFSQAPGVVTNGERQSQFSWFSGYSWMYAHCCRCSVHLGWGYQKGRVLTFFGLIADKLFFAE